MRSYGLFLMAIGLVGCGDRGDHGAGDAAVARAPSRGGEVWEADKASDRRAAPATLVAFVNGLHTIVLDGHDVYAGTTRLHASDDSAGTLAVPLSNGLTARLLPAGDAMELRFSSGESVALRKQTRRSK
jgi:2-methylcitrate dehydratase PrpD